jgi:hypothetical protein
MSLDPRLYRLLLFVALAGVASAASARVWTDSTGKYTIEADLIAFNDKSVVLQRGDHELGLIPIDKLSQADRDFLRSEEAGNITTKNGEMQTWTMANGLKVLGHVVDFARHDVTIQRRRGRIYVNDRLFSNLPEIYQMMLPKIVSFFERINPEDKSGLESWAVRQRGQPRTFTLEGVVLELENGDEYAVPFFLFSEEDQQLLKGGWERWLAAHGDYDQQQDHSFQLQALVAAHLHNQQAQRQIAMMQLQLQAVQAGLTSLWEVTLYPVRGNPNPPQWVVMPGRNSQDATNAALEKNPGFVAGPVRRVGS